MLNSNQIPATGWEGCGLPRNRKKIKPTKNQSIQTKYNLDDMFLVIPGGRSGMFHFKIEIEESFSYCNLSVSTNVKIIVSFISFSLILDSLSRNSATGDQTHSLP